MSDNNEALAEQLATKHYKAMCAKELGHLSTIDTIASAIREALTARKADDYATEDADTRAILQADDRGEQPVLLDRRVAEQRDHAAQRGGGGALPGRARARAARGSAYRGANTIDIGVFAKELGTLQRQEMEALLPSGLSEGDRRRVLAGMLTMEIGRASCRERVSSPV